MTRRPRSQTHADAPGADSAPRTRSAYARAERLQPESLLHADVADWLGRLRDRVRAGDGHDLQRARVLASAAFALLLESAGRTEHERSLVQSAVRALAAQPPASPGDRRPPQLQQLASRLDRVAAQLGLAELRLPTGAGRGPEPGTVGRE